MRGSDYADLKAVLAIVEHRSFARAAAHLRVSPSALSQTVRGLEERLGMRLLNRTTRSVAPTEAGQRLLSRIGPAFQEFEAAVDELSSLREEPAGLLRINAPRLGAIHFIAPLIGRFHAAYPDIKLDIMIDNTIADIVADRFDAGVRLGETLDKDMVALKLSGEFSQMAVATPDYFRRHGVPATPRDLHRHHCINIRWPTDRSLYRWEFEREGESFDVAVDGPLTVNDPDLQLQAALDGVGIAYMFDLLVKPLVETGRLQRCLADWSPSFPGFYLYYPSRRQMPPPLRAFIDFIRGAPLIAG